MLGPYSIHIQGYPYPERGQTPLGALWVYSSSLEKNRGRRRPYLRNELSMPG